MAKKILGILGGLGLGIGMLVTFPGAPVFSATSTVWGYIVLTGWVATTPTTIESSSYWGPGRQFGIITLRTRLPRSLVGFRQADNPQIIYDAFRQQPRSVENMLGTYHIHNAIAYSISLLKIWQKADFNPAAVGGPNIPAGFYTSYAQKHLGILVVAHYNHTLKPGSDIPGLPKPPGDAKEIAKWRYLAARNKLKMPKLPRNWVDYRPTKAQQGFSRPK